MNYTAASPEALTLAVVTQLCEKINVRLEKSDSVNKEDHGTDVRKTLETLDAIIKCLISNKNDNAKAKQVKICAKEKKNKIETKFKNAIRNRIIGELLLSDQNFGDEFREEVKLSDADCNLEIDIYIAGRCTQQLGRLESGSIPLLNFKHHIHVLCANQDLQHGPSVVSTPQVEEDMLVIFEIASVGSFRTLMEKVSQLERALQYALIKEEATDICKLIGFAGVAMPISQHLHNEFRPPLRPVPTREILENLFHIFDKIFPLCATLMHAGRLLYVEINEKFPEVIAAIVLNIEKTKGQVCTLSSMVDKIERSHTALSSKVDKLLTNFTASESGSDQQLQWIQFQREFPWDMAAMERCIEEIDENVGTLSSEVDEMERSQTNFIASESDSNQQFQEKLSRDMATMERTIEKMERDIKETNEKVDTLLSKVDEIERSRKEFTASESHSDRQFQSKSNGKIKEAWATFKETWATLKEVHAMYKESQLVEDVREMLFPIKLTHDLLFGPDWLRARELRLACKGETPSFL